MAVAAITEFSPPSWCLLEMLGAMGGRAVVLREVPKQLNRWNTLCHNAPYHRAAILVSYSKDRRLCPGKREKLREQVDHRTLNNTSFKVSM